MLEEVDNKALQHNFDVLNAKILETNFDLYFNALIRIKQVDSQMTNFAGRKTFVQY